MKQEEEDDDDDDHRIDRCKSPTKKNKPSQFIQDAISTYICTSYIQIMEMNNQGELQYFCRSLHSAFDAAKSAPLHPIGGSSNWHE